METTTAQPAGNWFFQNLNRQSLRGPFPRNMDPLDRIQAIRDDGDTRYFKSFTILIDTADLFLFVDSNGDLIAYWKEVG